VAWAKHSTLRNALYESFGVDRGEEFALEVEGGKVGGGKVIVWETRGRSTDVRVFAHPMKS